MQKVTAKTVLTLSLAIVVLALIVSAISRFTGQTRITIPASVTVAGAASKTVTPSTAPTAATAVSHATTSVTATASVSSGHQLSANLRQKLELGRQAFDNRHYAQSIALEDEVLQADPQAYEADSIKGIAQAYRGNFTQAMATLDQA
ncbi:MAG TPA: hypothetical protein VHQ46_05360, partial [Desulfobacteria bacterium]|nr:hypothetical protein [Desulfobacteria bacterium]